MTLPLLPDDRPGREAPALCARAEEIVRGIVVARDRALRDLLALCESPIEAILLAALCARWEGRVSVSRKGLVAQVGDDAGLRIVVEPQHVIQTQTATYRADLFAFVTRSQLETDPERWGATVIEVDGHEFHERTKEQAATDRRRDRALVGEGMRVVRFTGSEVFAAPGACAKEIDELMRRTARSSRHAGGAAT